MVICILKTIIMKSQEAREIAEQVKQEQYKPEYENIINQITQEANKGNLELIVDGFISEYSNIKLQEENHYKVAYLVDKEQTKINW